MGDASGQLSDGLELLRLLELFLQGPLFGDVGASDEKAGAFARGEAVDVDDGEAEEAPLAIALEHHIVAFLKFPHAEPGIDFLIELGVHPVHAAVAQG